MSHKVNVRAVDANDVLIVEDTLTITSLFNIGLEIETLMQPLRHYHPSVARVVVSIPVPGAEEHLRPASAE
ncbi:hypothetical protein [Methylobacterium ajmalii]|uniref:hypothetical protein n=1 Tax=Methylobacterium ajmalii TaxID=2738439 RepID=UPI002F360B27